MYFQYIAEIFYPSRPKSMWCLSVLSTSQVVSSSPKCIAPDTFCRFAAQDSIKIRRDAVPTANDSNKSVSLLPFRHKLRLSFQLMPSTQACAIWVLAQMVVLVR
jgi:hypothetical protein